MSYPKKAITVSSRSFSLLDHPTVQRALPWLAGAGMAVGHAAVSANCTLPQQGRCAACGSCVLVVGALVTWAVAAKRRGAGLSSETHE
jgi:hypothetical protein